MKNSRFYHYKYIARTLILLRPGIAWRIQARACNINWRAKLEVNASYGKEIAFTPDEL